MVNIISNNMPSKTPAFAHDYNDPGLERKKSNKVFYKGDITDYIQEQNVNMMGKKKTKK